MLSVIMLNVTYKPFVLSTIRPCVVRLSVEAPVNLLKSQPEHKITQRLIDVFDKLTISPSIP
jgi:hypothetical protein